MNIKNEIIIKGARLNNLKNISVNIPKNKIVVITGVSGSGKSTLAYDTIYAEAQRRYIESLSSYARQFLKNHSKPEVDHIKGLSPAIAIKQKTNTNNSKSTIGTATEIYYYLTLLYERIGKTMSPISGKEVINMSFDDFKKYIYTLRPNMRFLICANIDRDLIEHYQQKGFSRVISNEKIEEIEECKVVEKEVKLIIDRLIFKASSEFDFILLQAYNQAIEIGSGVCFVHNEDGAFKQVFNSNFTLDDIIFEKPHKDLFNFNNPYGACKNCNGHGDLIDLDPNKIVPNKNLSILQDAIHPWRNGKMEKWKKDLISKANNINFPVNKNYSTLSKKEKDILWNGKDEFKGLFYFFAFLKKKSYKIQYRVMLSRYRSLSICKECSGNRLRKEAQYVRINNQNIAQSINLNIRELLIFVQEIRGMDHKKKIVEKLKDEITSRLQSMIKLGLHYLTLNRKCNSLSGGETQKINISKSIGSGLIGSLYILDEPTIGLHSKDTNQLIEILQKLKNLGNSIIIVEHDKEIIKSSDHIIDIGPFAGLYGGEIIYSGPITKTYPENSLTLNYVHNKMQIKHTLKDKNPTDFIDIYGAKANNLKNINVSIPLNVFTAITGLSGSGKTTLLKEILLPGIKRKLKDYSFEIPECKNIDIDIKEIENIDFLNQSSIKKSSKSTPITYISAFDKIRNLLASEELAKINNLSAKHFSFNVLGGRCDHCKGQGCVVVEMQFLSDIKLKCEICNGKRYREEVLQICFNNHNIYDILNLTVQEAYDFFVQHKEIHIASKIKPLIKVGLSYLKLGQSMATLSSGEIQRLKLGSFLSNENKKSILIFDEPTKGLHFHDIQILINAFEELIKIGNTIIIIEHNLDVIKNVDWVIELGPDSGSNGGSVVFAGKPSELINKNTHTGLALKKEIN